MKKFLLPVLACLFLAGIPGLSIAQEKAPPKQETRDFNDWRLICQPGKEGKKQCGIFQRVMFGKDKAKDKGLALVAQMRVGKVKGNPATIVRLAAPLGTLLPPGIAMKVDDGKQIKAPFLLCLKGGCIVETVLANDVLTKLKSGKSMLVAYRTPDGKDNTVQLSLKGFTEAHAALEKS